MLVKVNAANRNSDDHSLTLAGECAFCSEFKHRKGTEIFGEGGETEYVYQIISGAVRTHRRLADGRRQINSFHLPGDMFGLENGARYRFSAEALVETKVRIVNQRNLLAAFESRANGRTQLLRLVTQSLRHAENHMLLLGRKTALEKVAAFILEMDERQAHPDAMVLPMGRRDIADYLGLSLETVSRALSTLQEEGLLWCDGATRKRFIILSRAGLAKYDA